MKTMADPAYKLEGHYTYGDYKLWPEGERWELIHGEAWAMSPGPNRRHQGLSGFLFNAIFDYLKGKPCLAYSAPFDILFPESSEADEDEIDTVLQPDIVVVCDRSRLRPYGIRGAPDLVVEIVSPYTSKRDLKDKFEVYENHGVREYWVVFPDGGYVHRYGLGSDGKYKPADILVEKGVLESSVLEGFSLDIEELFKAE
jgi:Uma2 family endonuclease